MNPLAHARTDRRGFLRLLGSGAALTALSRLPAGAAGAVAAAEPASGEAFFDPRAREILTQVVERMVATGEPGAPPVRETGAIDTLDRLCRGLDPALTRPLPMLLRLVDWGPLLFDLRFQRFTRMSESDRDLSLESWRRSRLALRRTAFLALRNLASFGYWSQPETWPLIGYQGPLLGTTQRRAAPAAPGRSEAASRVPREERA